MAMGWFTAWASLCWAREMVPEWRANERLMRLHRCSRTTHAATMANRRAARKAARVANQSGRKDQRDAAADLSAGSKLSVSTAAPAAPDRADSGGRDWARAG